MRIYDTNPYIGVRWDPRNDNWKVTVPYMGGYRILGRFDEKSEAIQARKDWEETHEEMVTSKNYQNYKKWWESQRKQYLSRRSGHLM